MDYANEAIYTRRAPRDDFDAELYRQYIQHEAARWYDTDEIHVCIGETPDEDGFYELYIYEPHDDPLRMMEVKGEVRGKVWLAERLSPASEYYRIAVWHEVEGFSNTGAAPKLRYE